MKGRTSVRGQFNKSSKSSSTRSNSYDVGRSKQYVPFDVEEPVFEFVMNGIGHEDDVFSMDLKLPELHEPEDNGLNDSSQGKRLAQQRDWDPSTKILTDTVVLSSTPVLSADEEFCDVSHRVGAWNDRWLDCFAYGACHSSVLISLFFPFLALGQIMVRLKTVRWIALPTYRTNDPFRVAILLTMFWITINCLIYYLAIVTPMKWILFFVIGGIMHFYFVANAIRTRLATRRRFGIEESWKNEDLWVGGIVPTFSVMQLLRHTGDYERLAGHGFTATGLALNVRFVLPTVQQEDDQYSIFSELSDAR